MHIPNDGTFNTKEINAAYRRLAKKYHPDAVNPEKVPVEKAQKRWYNLVKAHETLTKTNKFRNWNIYGDPDGSPTMKALSLAMPTWLFGEATQPLVLGGFFVFLLFAILALKVW